MDRVTSDSISNNLCFRTSHVATKCKPRGFAPVDSNVPVQVQEGPMDRVTSDSISNNLCFRTSHLATTWKPRGFAPVDSNVLVQVLVGAMDRVTSDSISNNLCFWTSHVATTWLLRVNRVALLRLTKTYRYKYTWAPWTEYRVTQSPTIYVLGPATWLPRGPCGFAPVDLNVPVQVHVGPIDTVTSDSMSNNLCFRTSHVATTWSTWVCSGWLKRTGTSTRVPHGQSNEWLNLQQFMF